MKKSFKIIALIAFVLITSITFAQPPDPVEDPNVGGDELGGNAPIGTGIVTLLVLGGGYALVKTSRPEEK